MQITTFANCKGGVSKTTTCNVLATGLANSVNNRHKKFRCLVIDLDPQSNETFSAGVDPLSCENTIYDVFKGESNINDVIKKSPLGFDLCPGGLGLSGADMEFAQIGREKMLDRAVSELDDNYDFVLIDTPPTLGLLTTNALCCVSGAEKTALIIPMSADIYSLQGLSQIGGFVENVRRYGNPQLIIDGLLITKYNARQNLTKALEDEIEKAAEELGTKIYNSKIRESVAIREAALMQSNVFTELPKSNNAVVDYKNFIEEFLGDHHE